jgi:hypothetical protein
MPTDTVERPASRETLICEKGLLLYGIFNVESRRETAITYIYIYTH